MSGGVSFDPIPPFVSSGGKRHRPLDPLFRPYSQRRVPKPKGLVPSLEESNEERRVFSLLRRLPEKPSVLKGLR